MKKLNILFAVVCFSVTSVQAQSYEFPKKEGFRCVLDASVGYAAFTEETVFKIAPVFGKQFGFGLYIGVGPELTISLGKYYDFYEERDHVFYYGLYGVSVGGYAKVRYTPVQIRSKVLPFVEVRAGYRHYIEINRFDSNYRYRDFCNADEDAGFGGFGIGVSFRQKVCIGFFTSINKEAYGEYRRFGSDGYECHHSNWTPSFFFSLDF